MEGELLLRMILNMSKEIISYFFSLVGSSVKIYSSVTGLVVSTLTTPPTIDEQIQSDVLTSVVLNPHNAFQLITGSLDGRVMIWDFVNATLLQTINLGQPIHLMCTHEQFKESIFVAASKTRQKVVSNGKFIRQQTVTLPTNFEIKTTMLSFCEYCSSIPTIPAGLWKWCL